MTTRELILNRIESSFPAKPFPADAELFFSDSFEVDGKTMERLARGNTWREIDSETLYNNRIGLAFMTPQGFAWFLPAYLVVSVEEYEDAGALTSTIITCLTPPDAADAHRYEELVDQARALGLDVPAESSSTNALGADEEIHRLLVERASVLTEDQKATVRAYLEYMQATHGDDFPVFGPQLALDRYWTAAIP